MRIKTPFFDGIFPAKRMAEVISVMALAVAGFTSYLLWEHTRDTTRVLQLIWSLKQEQRMTNCIMSLPVDRREAEFREHNSFCNRMASGLNPGWAYPKTRLGEN